MKSDIKWTEAWPTKPGMYWFYGWPYGKDEKNPEEKPELNLIEIRAISNGVMVIRSGQFWFKREGGVGKFTEVDLPELPLL